ncbi:MAG: twin-arginine translocase subunit TatC [Anaerolineae bacterium]|nr:twin-arginine translocase subunit TatC [Anaerolineae bacterium]
MSSAVPSLPPDPNQVTAEQNRLAGQMSLLEHLDEMRDRVVKSFIVVVVATFIVAAFTPRILKFLIVPYGRELLVIGPTEGIAIYFRVALTGGLVLAMPVIIYHLLMFILPGLNEGEKQYVRWGVPAATILFLVGISFSWFILIPTAIEFLSGWQSDIFNQEWQSQKYIPFVTSLIFWIGISFETPLLIFIMAKLGLVTPKFLWQNWRFAVIIIAIASAMITPTIDPFNMALVMLPLMALYGLSILLAYLA